MITLTGYGQTAVVDTQGAVVQRYASNGRDVLYPRQTLDNKWRGGSHVCAPNFGPGGESDQPQHGFAREVAWQVMQQDETSVELRYRCDMGDYAGLALVIRYQLTPEGLRMEIEATNQADRPLRYAPGWHPYFVMPVTAARQVQIGEQSYDTNELAEMQLHHTTRDDKGVSRVVVTAGDRVYRLTTNLPALAVWSGHPDAYVCVEPTAEGNGFSERSLDEGYHVQPGEQVVHYCYIQG